jgi:predicted AlkP superfamily pyrophosphatase or phosphodiesterase
LITQRNLVASVFLLSWSLSPAAYAQHSFHDRDEGSIRHVLLISVDGMRVVDYINCAYGISGVNNGEPYCPNLAALGHTGVNYLEASASKPSDSFRGLMAIVAGGSPRTVGALNDVAGEKATGTYGIVFTHVTARQQVAGASLVRERRFFSPDS